EHWMRYARLRLVEHVLTEPGHHAAHAGAEHSVELGPRRGRPAAALAAAETEEGEPMNNVEREHPILCIDGLTVDFLSDDDPVRAVDDVSFHVRAGETLVILGESGSGKSVSTSTVMGLVDCPP